MTTESKQRPTWDDYFIDIAKAVARRADCTRQTVGCVIVDQNRHIIGTGYNGTIPGRPGCLAGKCPRGRLDPFQSAGPFTDDPESPSFCIAIHAEANAILNATANLQNAVVYSTHKPCISCQKLLAGARIYLVLWPGGWLYHENLAKGPLD